MSTYTGLIIMKSEGDIAREREKLIAHCERERESLIEPTPR
jgi:hypothetical protein